MVSTEVETAWCLADDAERGRRRRVPRQAASPVDALLGAVLAVSHQVPSLLDDVQRAASGPSGASASPVSPTPRCRRGCRRAARRERVVIRRAPMAQPDRAHLRYPSRSTNRRSPTPQLRDIAHQRSGVTMTRRPDDRRGRPSRRTPARPPEHSRPGRKATLHVLASAFVTLGPADRDAAITALAMLLAPQLNDTGPMMQPDETME